tara:strand:+ start:202 stop:363 length:162 start_codon:yes stop_codon:yes gene_type:complete
MLFAFLRVGMSVLFLSIREPVLSAALKLVVGVTLVATAECIREISVSMIIAVP